jgi:hypothetical protein
LWPFSLVGFPKLYALGECPICGPLCPAILSRFQTVGGLSPSVPFGDVFVLLANDSEAATDYLATNVGYATQVAISMEAVVRPTTILCTRTLEIVWVKSDVMANVDSRSAASRWICFALSP